MKSAHYAITCTLTVILTQVCPGSDAQEPPAKPSPAQAMLNAVSQSLHDTQTQHPGLDPSNPEAVAAFIRDFQKNSEKNGIKPTANAARPITSAEVDNLYKNLAGIKELFERAEANFKAGHFRDAALAYQSVSLSTLAGSEDYAAQARDRLIEIEGKAKDNLKLARDKGMKSQYVEEAADLEFLMKEFPDTVAGKQSLSEMAALRSRPEAAAFLDIEQAKALLQRGSIAAAVERFIAVAENPRYQNTVGSIEARRQAKELNDNPVLRKAIDSENVSKAERDAKARLAMARNLLKSDANDKAIAALNEIIVLYPDTPAAGEAKKLLDTVK